MKKTALLFMAALVLLCMVSCGKDDPAVDDVTVSTAESTTSYDFYKSEKDVNEVKSKYCSLFYPSKWKDNIETAISENETMYKVSFTAVFGEVKIPLYDFIFGLSEDGYLLGTVKTDKGTKNIYLEEKSSLYDGRLSGNDELLYFEMSSGVNDIISNLVYNSGMTLIG